MSRSVAGAWTGVVDITACSARFCAPGPEAFALRIGKDGTGVFLVQPTSSDPPLAVSIQSQIGADGTVVVTGTTPGPRRLDMRLSVDGMATYLEGTIQYTLDRYGDSPVANEGHILFSQRETTTRVGRFEGAWSGLPATATCTGDCTEIRPLEWDGIRVSISQAGSHVSGDALGVTLSGEVDGEQLRASGQYAVAASACRPVYDGTTCLREATLSATADPFDRLHGSLAYHENGYDYLGRRYDVRVDAALDGLARWR